MNEFIVSTKGSLWECSCPKCQHKGSRQGSRKGSRKGIGKNITDNEWYDWENEKLDWREMKKKLNEKGVDVFQGERWDKSVEIAEENGFTPKDFLPENPFNQTTPDGRKKFIKYYMETIPKHDFHYKRHMDEMFTLETLEEVMSNTEFWKFLERYESCGAYYLLMHITDSFRKHDLTNKLFAFAKRANNKIAMEAIIDGMEPVDFIKVDLSNDAEFVRRIARATGWGMIDSHTRDYIEKEAKEYLKQYGDINVTNSIDSYACRYMIAKLLHNDTVANEFAKNIEEELNRG